MREFLSGIWIVQLLTACLRSVPRTLSEKALSLLGQLFLLFSPRHKRVAKRNLSLAFPEKDEIWRRATLKSSFKYLAKVLIDFSRLPKLTPQWVDEHVECDFIKRYRVLKDQNPREGILIATGHLGSFELLAHCMPMWGHPLSFVVRNFKWRALDSWWTKSRERFGNKVINRKGAFREVGQLLQEGRDVALLFDQNVKRKHAVFVDWFGIPAATSKTVAIAALRAKSKVMVAGILSLPNDRYRVLADQYDFAFLYGDESVPSEEKVRRITQVLAHSYEKMIRQQPEAWFWLHRRWRTRPDGDTENLYAGC